MALSGNQLTAIGGHGSHLAYAGFLAKEAQSIEQVSPCPITDWTDAATNTPLWQHVNPESAVWDGGAALWDLRGNVYEAVWDAKDTVWNDIATNTPLYEPAQECLKWDNGTVEWDLRGNVYTARWR